MEIQLSILNRFVSSFTKRVREKREEENEDDECGMDMHSTDFFSNSCILN